MKRKPKIFLFMSAVFAAVGLSLPLQVMLAFGHPPTELTEILAKLTPMNWIVMSVSFANALLAYHASPALKYAGPLFVFVVGWNNWLVSEYFALTSDPAEDPRWLWAFISTLLAALSVCALFLRDAGLALLEPTLRWWRISPRKLLAVAAHVRQVTGPSINTRTYDVSKSGAFFAFEEGVDENRRQVSLGQIQVGSRCSVRLALDQLRTIQCAAEVVRKAEPNGKYPGGFAVRFVGLSLKDQGVLTQLCS
ncbi:MAG: PilZ domain-containing protein [Bacteriovoracia bacterium]